MTDDLKSLWDKAHQRARERNTYLGLVGKHNPDASITYEVTGRKDYLWVTLENKTVIQARNEGSVAQIEDLPVKLRLDHGTFVIEGRATSGALATPTQTPVAGGWAHEILDHTDANLSPADGDAIVWDAGTSKWVAAPVAIQETVEDWVAAQFTGNTGVIDATYNDTTGAITLTLDVSVADRILYSTGADAWAETALTSFARTLLDDADQATMQATLAVTPEHIQDIVGAMVTGNTESLIVVTYQDSDGTIDFEITDAELVALAGLTSAADRLPYFTGSGTAALATFTSFGRSQIDDADAAAGRATLELVAGATGDIWVEKAGDTMTGNLAVESVAVTGNSLAVLRNLAAASTNAPMVAFVQDNASDDQAALIVQQDGTGDIVSLYDGGTEVFEVRDGGQTVVTQIGTTGNALSVTRDLASGSTDAPMVSFVQDNASDDQTAFYLRNDGSGTLFHGVGDRNGAIQMKFENLNAGASAAARIWIDAVGGLGDAYMLFSIDGAGTEAWTLGIDNSDSDKFKISDNTLLGTNDRIVIDSSGNVGIGTASPQGKLHVHDGTGGQLFVSKTAIDGTAQTIIPDGSGDVVRGMFFLSIVMPSSGSVFMTSNAIANNSNADIYSNAGNVLNLRVNSNGSVDVRRTGGSLTYSLSLFMVWM